ncbi:hypothetical protein PIB30_033462 [Stylosanthes scabra]|uniref:Uncharacterized protein n=1 Tax=Stylosanthes scabra TaxID=79078 RepID=A0ABU6VEH5_9FABA|nr:hypothetical protein [Stylosanthes scabra]
MFGKLPKENDRDTCTMTFSWLKSRFGELLDDASDEFAIRHARAYIWMLLSTSLFGGQDCSSGSRSLAPFSRAHRRARSIHLGFCSPCLAVQESVPSSQQECRLGGRAVGSATELDFLAVSDPYALQFRHFRVTIGLQVGGRYLPTSDEKGPRLQTHRRQLDLMPFRVFVCLLYRTQAVEVVVDRSILQEDHRALWCSIIPFIYFGTIEWYQVDQVIPQFGGVQNRPHAPLNIDFMHAKDGRGSD